MTPDERAEQIMQKLDDETFRNDNGDFETPLYMAKALIASAIRAAENEALERASALIAQSLDDEWQWIVDEAVEALKHPEP